MAIRKKDNGNRNGRRLATQQSVDQLTTEAVDPTHVFTLSQVYDGLLLKMGEKGNDGGQFFTPRQVLKSMVQVIDTRALCAIFPVAWHKITMAHNRHPAYA